MPGFRLSAYVILEEDVPHFAGAFPLLASVPECVRLALDSIRAHKLRSFLTLLGVIIGVASVIMVGAAIDGLGVYAEQSTAKAFGSESFLVAQIASTGNLSRREYFDKIKRNKPIRTDDARFLESVERRPGPLQPLPQPRRRYQARQSHLRRHHRDRRLGRHGGYPRHRRDRRPLLHDAGRPRAHLRRRDRRYRAHHAVSRRRVAARENRPHRAASNSP